MYDWGVRGGSGGGGMEGESLVKLGAWHQRVYQVAPADRGNQVASPAFDAAVWEIWAYLTCGASVHIPDEDTRLSPKRLLDWLAASRITLSFIPTPLAEALFDEPWPENTSLRALVTGGDKLHRPPSQEVPGPTFNHYRP